MSPNIPSPVNLSPAMFGISSSPAMMGSPTNANAAAAAAMMQSQSAAAPNLSALMTQQRLLEMSGFNLRGYDLAQHMLSQQGNVSKLLGECKSPILFYSYIIMVTTFQCSRFCSRTPQKNGATVKVKVLCSAQPQN